MTLFGAVGLEEGKDVLCDIFHHPCGESGVLQMRNVLCFYHLVFLQWTKSLHVEHTKDENEFMKMIYRQTFNRAWFLMQYWPKANSNLPEQCHWRESTWQVLEHCTSDCRASSRYLSGCWLVYCCPWKTHKERKKIRELYVRLNKNNVVEPMWNSEWTFPSTSWGQIN